ncbi:sialate O-acetylesterase [Anseongella ginsenosidimutans]|uniref:Sialate O-acetylesterase n=1 Tax=Anseongella ginsenosidimutans TaxID=496056 RepID=A0A4R3KN39_9SPHI|nr:sialate O-acetylesterase [Anseongella ginsenosidimutans]QEC52397.1 sialate O-acetylesterase [Anseongella ginsenosidimutans]TCS85861.1 sialate O-acetylesterase [Anseongella ginsenosidimutans]
MKNLRTLLLAGLLLFSGGARAEITLPAIIGNNMVLQRQSDVKLWGKANANAQVSVMTSWDEKQYSTKADAAGNWKLTVQTPAAGGPYEINFRENGRDGGQKGASITLSNILIGEVWVCSGQSNMEMPLKGYRNQPILNANEILTTAGEPMIRLFHLERAASATELFDCKGAWEVSSAGSAVSFSAVGFQFAKKLQAILGVPVGVIQTAWGGTPIEAWTDKESLSAVPGIEIPFPSDSVEAGRLVSTCLYNGMIAPIAGFGIKGFLWYQGEANRARPGQYAQLMEAMVTGWRKKWGNDSLPFYYAQIAPYDYPTHAATVPYLREAQLKAMELIPFSGMAVSMDVGSSETIHPPDKTTIAERLLYWALAKTYDMEGIACEGPVYKSMKIDGNKVLLSFENAPSGFVVKSQGFSCFEIAGADKTFYPATAEISKGGILVQSDKVDKPVAVRYAFKDWVEGDLYNTAGLPASSFRTDDWPAE